jgi:hypothetical protein
MATLWPIGIAAIGLSVTAPAQTVRHAPPAGGQPVVLAATADAQPTLLGQFGDWGAYTASPGGAKVCFALAKPRSMQTDPPGRKHTDAFFFISTRPAENVRNEVSVLVDFQFREGSEATAEISNAKFSMYTQNDGAWIKNTNEEAQLLDAMRKGSDMTVSGTSSRGTKVIDQFSLSGVSQALDRIAQECK